MTGKVRESARRAAVLYWNNPFGTVVWRRAERHFLSRWLDSGECAAKVSSPAAELGTGLRVMRLDRGAFDAMPVSVISDSTVSALCTLARVPGNELRFRPNVVVTLDSGAAFEEDEWVGSAVRIGAAVVRMDRRDSRCIVVNVDLARGLPDSHLLKVVGTTRGACAGVYATTVRPGLIRVGDPVVVEMRPQD